MTKPTGRGHQTYQSRLKSRNDQTYWSRSPNLLVEVQPTSRAKPTGRGTTYQSIESFDRNLLVKQNLLVEPNLLVKVHLLAMFKPTDWSRQAYQLRVKPTSLSVFYLEFFLCFSSSLLPLLSSPHLRPTTYQPRFAVQHAQPTSHASLCRSANLLVTASFSELLINPTTLSQTNRHSLYSLFPFYRRSFQKLPNKRGGRYPIFNQASGGLTLSSS